MKLSNLKLSGPQARAIGAALFSTALLGSATLQSAWASEGAADERPMAQKQEQQQDRMQMRLEKMRSQMAEIEAANDPAERRRLMEEHMRQMHEAVGMMSKDMMPAMKRRMHTHTHAPGAGRQGDDDMRSQEHMQKMEQMMSHMEGLMEQMSKHQAMREAQNEG